MPKRRGSTSEPSRLVARIEAVEQTYYVSAGMEHGHYVDDEAILDVIGRIEEISPHHKRFLDRRIEMSFVCSHRYPHDGPVEGGPRLFNINLRKDQCSFLVYLPAAPFWAVPPMIASGAFTHVEARFAELRYGSADLLSAYFAPASKVLGDCPIGSKTP